MAANTNDAPPDGQTPPPTLLRLRLCRLGAPLGRRLRRLGGNGPIHLRRQRALQQGHALLQGLARVGCLRVLRVGCRGWGVGGGCGGDGAGSAGGGDHGVTT
jgi:hypothetical protein